ncbi:tyrosine-protein phosphatase [Pelosinus fermentans]|uniref:protein-tyrosine-phosphatase n=1 Tax=Pelosinus fermentans JBW45 TaxID=1192197 RepID=I8TVZ0_9FIRM|nr:CpsB/CapC family capsule biosynthesis tyrosine phosphatase [Pelosinus fermentans]AJQ26006.1 Protein-tyrosine-phosphatase [Pelosinus fermentans JBW45]
MFDLHSHIIPGIDDGSKYMEMSLAMLQMAVENGTKGIVATPHIIEGEWLPAWDRVLAECDTLRQEAQKAGIEIPIFPGGEVAIHFDILEKLKGPGSYCINGGRYLLVELPANHIPSFTDDFFFALQARGITPILAHPERHPEIAKKPELLVEWIGKGILTQMNGTSITGHMGERVMATAELLLVNNMVHSLGSDAHRINHRNTNLTPAIKKITELIGIKKTQSITVENSNHIISGKDVDIPTISDIQYPKKTKGIMAWIGSIWK